MKTNHTWHDLTLLLAICVGVFFACFCVLAVADKRETAQYRVNMYKHDLQGWEACRRTKPALFRENEEAISHCVTSLAEAQASFWVNLPPRQLDAVAPHML